MTKPSRPTRASLLALTACLVLAAGCSGAEPSPAPAPAASASSAEQEALQGTDAVAIIDALDASQQQRPMEGLKASVKADQLVLTDDRGERTLPIPDDKFYLSVAPYLTQTHECFAHSLSGCQGEQAKKQMHITITAKDGSTLVDEDVTTGTNGFVGFWLPRDVQGTITATMDGKSGTVPFATAQDSPTCLTTLQMA
ncbi:CueP family metal-binding protein [Luteococcus sp. OSA5]|uniref:CueP family metal-binding protein n=1 Tax=Luteococcus sp. OSA5 TaxID=3401630 RepID=UPI003B438A4B